MLDCIQLSDLAKILLSVPEERASYGFESAAAAKRVVKEMESLRNHLAHAQDITRHDWAQIARLARRVEEMRQSVRIIRQCLDKMPEGPILAKVPKVLRTKEEGMVYASVESSKGELGYFIVATPKGTSPYRCRVRPPSFVNLQMLPEMMRGGLVADLTAVIATLDIVLGEIDR